MFKNPLIKTLLGLSLGLLTILIIGYLFLDIVIYIVISVIVAAVLKIPTNYINQIQIFKARIPRVIAVTFSFLLLFSFITLFVYLFVPLISHQIKVISAINIEELMNSAMLPIEYIEAQILKFNILDEQNGFLVKTIKSNLLELFKTLRPTMVIRNIFSITGNFFVGGLAVLFITFFLLYEKGAFRNGMISLIPNKYFEVSIALLGKIESMLANYLFGLLIQMISVFSIVAFGLLMAGVDYAVTIAVFAALVNLIPYIGPIVGASFGLIVGLSTSSDFATANQYYFMIIEIVAVFGIVQLTDNILLQPIIFSRSVKAHPLEIFLIVFVGATLAGPVGMVVAIPTYTIIKVSIMEFYKGYKQYAIFRQ